MKKVKLLFISMVILSLAISCKKSNSEPEKQDQEEPELELKSVTPTKTPESLFLLLPDNQSIKLTKEGDIFITETYIPLEAEKEYTFNSSADGKGTPYFIKEPLSAYEYADDDKVVWDDPLLEVTQGEAAFTVERSQAYKLALNFETAEITWEYYNIQLFYYTDWEELTKVALSYKHPLKFEATSQLPDGNLMKFYSVNPDWLEWGSTSPQTLNGSLILGGGADMENITDAGNYLIKIELDGDLKTGEYSFIKQ